MNSHDALDRTVSLLRDGPIALPGADAERGRRERLVPLMRSLVVGTPRRLRKRRQLRFAGAAATVLACASLVWIGVDRRRISAPAPSETVLVAMPKAHQATWSDGANEPRLLGTHTRLPLRGTLRSLDDQSVALLTPLGVHVALSAHSEVGLVAVASSAKRSVLNLETGKVRCQVPRLSDGNVFSVRTRDAEVIVHGTVFSVEAPTTGRGETCVRVEEGRVEVRTGERYRMLESGSSFGCSEPPSTITTTDQPTSDEAPRAVVPDATATYARRPTNAATASSVRTPTTSGDPNGTLAQESRLLAVALVKEREGSRAKAREIFQQFVTRYPRSALVVEAKAGLKRTSDGP